MTSTEPTSHSARSITDAGDRVAAVFEVTGGAHAPERIARTGRVFHDDHPHAGLAGAEHVRCRRQRPSAEHGCDQVVGDLVVRPRVGQQFLGRRAFVIAHEARPSAPGTERGIDQRPPPGGGFVVEGDPRVLDSVGIRPHPVGATVESPSLPLLSTDRIQSVPHLACASRELFDLDALSLGDQLDCGERPHLADSIRVDGFVDET